MHEGGMHNAAYVALVRDGKTGKLYLYGCHSKSRQFAEWQIHTACQKDFNSEQIEIVDIASIPAKPARPRYLMRIEQQQNEVQE